MVGFDVVFLIVAIPLSCLVLCAVPLALAWAIDRHRRTRRYRPDGKQKQKQT